MSLRAHRRAESRHFILYVAGQPFPLIDPSDPHVATKIMYDFERGPYFSDDLAFHLFDAETGQIVVDSDGIQHYSIERHMWGYGGEERVYTIAALIGMGH